MIRNLCCFAHVPIFVFSSCSVLTVKLNIFICQDMPVFLMLWVSNTRVSVLKNPVSTKKLRAINILRFLISKVKTWHFRREMLSALLIFDFIQPAVEGASPRGRKGAWNARIGTLICGSPTLNLACSMKNLALICFKSCDMAAHQCASVSRHKQLTNVTLLCDLNKVEINSVKSLKSALTNPVSSSFLQVTNIYWIFKIKK